MRKRNGVENRDPGAWQRGAVLGLLSISEVPIHDALCGSGITAGGQIIQKPVALIYQPPRVRCGLLQRESCDPLDEREWLLSPQDAEVLEQPHWESHTHFPLDGHGFFPMGFFKDHGAAGPIGFPLIPPDE